MNVCLVEEGTGHSAVWKVSSTPDDPFRGIAGGVVEDILEIGQFPSDIAISATLPQRPSPARH